MASRVSTGVRSGAVVVAAITVAALVGQPNPQASIVDRQDRNEAMTLRAATLAVAGCTAGMDSDYNGDGARDIAIADPEAAVNGLDKAGLIRVVYGTSGTVQTITESAARTLSTSEAGDRFGHALATYDVNRDGCSDLVVGAPYEDVNGLADVGSVYVLLGAPGGLTTGVESLTWHQDVGTTADALEAGDWFGYSVAAGHTGAGEGFLLIGAPGEDLGAATDAGLVHYIRGSVNVGVDQALAGTTDSNESDDRFGYSVAGSAHHIVAGRPGESVGGHAFAGAASVYTHDLISGKPKLLRDVVSNTPLADEFFGKSVSTVVYRPVGAPAGHIGSLVAIGAPGTDLPGSINGTVLRDAGVVETQTATATEVVFTRAIVDMAVIPPTGGMPPRVVNDQHDGAYFGERVHLVNTTPAAEATAASVLMAVGVPGFDTTVPDAGKTRVMSPTLANERARTVTRDGSVLPGVPLTNELIGTALGGSAQHLYVASPYGDPAVYALAWSDLAAGTVAPTHLWKPGAGGIPAGEVAFGAAIG